jgi:hypothetical protein
VQSAVAVIMIASLLSLLLFVRVPGSGAWLRAALNASHAPVFAGVAAVLGILLRSRRRRARRAAWPDLRRHAQAFALATAVGVLIELLQSFMSRPPSLFDVGTDAAGAAIGLCLLALAERSQLPAPRPPFGPAAWTLVACALAGTLFVAWQPVQTARAYAERAQRFPVLAEFRDSVPLPMTRSVNASVAIEDLPAEWTRRPGERALRVRYQLGKSENAWPIRYLSFEPSPDWRGYATLVLDLVNPSPTELQLTLRIVDETHHWEFDPPPIVPITLPPSSRTTARIALGAIAAASEYRPPGLARMESLVLVPTEADATPEIYLLSIWLER